MGGTHNNPSPPQPLLCLWEATPAHASPAMSCSLAKPAVLASSLQRRCCCSSSARAISQRPPSSASLSSCSRCDGGGPPRIHPALPVLAAAAFVFASTTASFCPRLHLALHTCVRIPCPHRRNPLSVVPWYPPGALLPVCLRADVRQLDGQGGPAARDTLGHRPSVRRRVPGPLHVCRTGLEPQTSRPQAGLLLL